MTVAAPRLFDLAPLMAAAGPGTTQSRLQRWLGVSGSVLGQARMFGLTLSQADTWACRLGLHPGDVWPSWWLDIEDLDDESEAA